MGPKWLSFRPGPAPMRSWTDGSLLWKLSVTLGRCTEQNTTNPALQLQMACFTYCTAASQYQCRASGSSQLATVASVAGFGVQLAP